MESESSFLYEVVKRRKGDISYSSEKDIQSLVLTYLNNILRLMGIDENVEILQNSSLGINNSSDIWIVQSKNGVPVIVFEVKSPTTINNCNILENLNVHGQLFDYMTSLKLMFGQKEVFGIITTLESWRICCFEDTKHFAENCDLFPMPTEFNNWINDQEKFRRSYYTSKIISLNDNNLGKWIILFIHKAMHATFHKILLLSPHRCFLTYKTNTSIWEKINIKIISLIIPHSSTSNFSILRYFHGGSDGNVCLSITSSGHLCVLKFHYSTECQLHEINIWNNIYQIPCFQTTLQKTRKAMVMPLVFHVTSINNEKEIDFNLANWSKDKVVDAEPCDLLDKWTNKLMDFWNNLNMTVHLVAINAVKRLAESGYKHMDIKWSHVAIIPSIEGDDIIGMNPILIDLASVERCDNKEDALNDMYVQLRSMGIEIENK